MIALRKLEGIATESRLRKCAELLRILEGEVLAGTPVDTYYLAGLCAVIERSDTGDSIRETARSLENSIRKEKLSLSWKAPASTGRTCGSIASMLLQELGTPPAEWDLRAPATGRLDSGSRKLQPFDLFLEDIRSPFNVGSIFRSADAFGIRHIFLSPATPTPEQPRASRSAMGTTNVIPWTICSLREAVSTSRIESEKAGGEHRIMALETGGTAINSVGFPAAGLLILGNEEWGVSEEALEQADLRVTIPMGGTKASLNVAVAAGIAMQRWSEAVFTGAVKRK